MHNLQSVKGIITELTEKSSGLSTRMTDLSSLEKKIVEKFEEYDAKIQAMVDQLEDSRKTVVSRVNRHSHYHGIQSYCKTGKYDRYLYVHHNPMRMAIH